MVEQLNSHIIIGPNLGGNAEPAPGVAKRQTIKQDWHMHGIMTQTRMK